MDPIQEACARAGKKGRLVVAYVFRRRCSSAAMAERSLWGDPAVRAFLRTGAIFLRLDGELRPGLIDRYRIQSFPVILMAGPDGRELARLDWCAGPDRFLEAARAAAQGQDALSRLRASAAMDASPERRLDLAAALAARGRAAEALAEYLWCYDHGRERSACPSCGTQGDYSFVARDIARLGASYPPALAALRLRRQRAEARLRRAGAGQEAANEFITVSRALGEERRILELHDAADGGPARRLLEAYAAERRLAEVRRAGLLWDAAAEHARIAEAMRRSDAEEGPGHDDPFEPFRLRAGACADACRLFEALLGAGRAGEARAVAGTLRAFDGSGTTHCSLIRAADRCGDGAVAGELRAAAREALPRLPLEERAWVLGALAAQPR